MIKSNRVFDTLVELAACLCQTIESEGLPDTCFCGIVPGEAPAFGYWSDCEKNGMAYVRLSTSYPSQQIGQQSVATGNCSSLLGIDVEIGILRSLPVGDEQGNMPEDYDILEATQLQVADMIAMRKAVTCCLAAEDFLMGAYSPFGPDGGIVGGTWEINLQVD